MKKKLVAVLAFASLVFAMASRAQEAGPVRPWPQLVSPPAPVLCVPCFAVHPYPVRRATRCEAPGIGSIRIARGFNLAPGSPCTVVFPGGSFYPGFAR